MCGVFGFVGRQGGPGPDIARLREVALITQRRGAHAFGFAWLDQHGVLRMFKQTGPISDHMGLLSMVAGCRLLIGHCRYATQGDPRDNQNNHPHPVNGGWFVHNGKVMNYAELVRDHRLWPITECDSEALGLLAERAGGTNADRLLSAVMLAPGWPLVALGLWGRPRRLTVIRRGHPLHWGARKGDCYLGSFPNALPGTVAAVPDRTMIDFSTKGVRHVAF